MLLMPPVSIRRWFASGQSSRRRVKTPKGLRPDRCRLFSGYAMLNSAIQKRDFMEN